MRERRTEIERFEQALASVRSAFPALQIELTSDHPYVDALAEIPAQPGLDFDVSFNLQNTDELHLNVARVFGAGWFPCGDAEVFDDFVSALLGVIRGEYRVVESYIGASASSAVLERAAEGRWKRVSRSSDMSGCLPLPRRKVIVQNRFSA